MEPSFIYAVASAALFCMGLSGALLAEHPLRKLLAVNVMGAGVFLYLIASVFSTEGEVLDPVPHALVLTGIVVAVSATGMALSLVRRLHVATSPRGSTEGEGRS